MVLVWIWGYSKLRRSGVRRVRKRGTGRLRRNGLRGVWGTGGVRYTLDVKRKYRTDDV
jgi:hypothetical protein